MRKVIQVVKTGHPLTALCDDGTLWELFEGQWTELPPIPQPGPAPYEAPPRPKVPDAPLVLRGLGVR